MTELDPGGLMYKLLERIDIVNSVCTAITGDQQGVFKRPSLRKPELNPPALGFHHASSWLYVLYLEAGKIGVRFLKAKMSVYDIDPDKTLSAHYVLVQHLRTFLQHHLDDDEKRDRQTKAACENWFKEKCGTAVPGAEIDWKRCLGALLEEALAFVDGLLAVVRSIEQDESAELIVGEWKAKIDRYLAPHEIDELIVVAAADMGRDQIDPVALRRRRLDEWNKELAILKPGVDPREEARRMVELELLGRGPRLPITGTDIIKEFAISPGRLVDDLLGRAMTINCGSALSRDDLLRRLRVDALMRIFFPR